MLNWVCRPASFAAAFAVIVATSAVASEIKTNDDKAKGSDSVNTTLIAAGGVVIGAVATAFASAYSARQKVREIEVSYRLKLSESYLSNARQYTNGVYVPISIALSSFNDSYRRFRACLDDRTRIAQPEAESAFREACYAYLNELSRLYTHGASAFLTSSLEERLGSFHSFLETSMQANNVVSRVVIVYAFPSLSRSVELFRG